MKYHFYKATSPFPQQQSNANPDNMEEDVTINQVRMNVINFI